MSLAISQIEELLKDSNDSKYSLSKQKAFVDFFDLNSNEEKKVEKFLQVINKFLGVGLTREIGFSCLNLILPHCPPHLLSEHCVHWIKTCIPQQTIQSISSERLSLIENLIKNCSDIQDFTKTITTSLFPKLLEVLFANLSTSRLVENSLACLQLCLRKYPSTCLPFKNKIEVLLLKYLDSNLPDSILKIAGSSYHYLQQVGGAGPEGINHINNWSYQLKKLCTTVHSLYDIFFENITEYDRYGSNDTPFDFPNVPSTTSTLDLMYITAKRLKNTLTFINSFLVEPFPVPKHIHSHEILAIVERGLSADCFKKIENTEDLQLAFMLYQNQIQLLLLMRSLIACLKYNILPQSFIISKLLLDCISRSQTYDYFTNKSDFQEVAYKVLSYWISIVRSNFNLTNYEKLINALINDITPAKSSLVLSISPEFAKKSQKLKQKTMQEQLSNMSSLTNRNTTENFKCIKECVCLGAANVLKRLCTLTTLTIKSQTIHKLHQVLVTTLLEIQEGRITHPYQNLKCQIALYELLLTLFEQKYSYPLPPLYIAINIFQTGQRSKNNVISQLCSNALRMLEHFCQPVCPTLYIANSLKDFVEDSTSKTFELSESREETNLEIFEIDTSLNDTEKECSTPNDRSLFNERSDSSDKVKILSVEVIKSADINIQTAEMAKEEKDNRPKNEKQFEDNEMNSVPFNKLKERTASEEKIVSSEVESDFSLCLSDDSNKLEPLKKKLKTDEEVLAENFQEEEGETAKKDKQVTTVTVVSNNISAEESIEITDNQENVKDTSTLNEEEEMEVEDMLNSFVDATKDE